MLTPEEIQAIKERCDAETLARELLIHLEVADVRINGALINEEAWLKLTVPLLQNFIAHRQTIDVDAAVRSIQAACLRSGHRSLTAGQLKDFITDHITPTSKPTGTQEEWAGCLKAIQKMLERGIELTTDPDIDIRVALQALRTLRSSSPAPQEAPKLDGDVGEIVQKLRSIRENWKIAHKELYEEVRDFPFFEEVATAIESLSGKLTKAEARVGELTKEVNVWRISHGGSSR